MIEANLRGRQSILWKPGLTQMFNRKVCVLESLLWTKAQKLLWLWDHPAWPGSASCCWCPRSTKKAEEMPVYNCCLSARYHLPAVEPTRTIRLWCKPTLLSIKQDYPRNKNKVQYWQWYWQAHPSRKTVGFDVFLFSNHSKYSEATKFLSGNTQSPLLNLHFSHFLQSASVVAHKV